MNMPPAPSLSPFEAIQLSDLEATIERARQSFVALGDALRAIRDGRLFRAMFGTFDEYCEARWGFTNRNANYLIAAADVVTNLRATGTIVPLLPATESQARELTRLEVPSLQVAAWEKVVDRVGSDPKRLTAKIVKEEVDRLLPEEDDPGFLAAEELAAIRKAVVARLKKCPPGARPSFAATVTQVVAEALAGVPAPDPDAVVGDAAPEPPHPFECLRERVIDLQRDIKAALNAGTPDAARLREIMGWCRVLWFPAGGPVEYLPTLGTPLLLRLAADPSPKPPLSEIEVSNRFLAAAGARQPPPKIVAKRMEAERRRRESS